MSMIFKSQRPDQVEPIDPSEDARALRRRIVARGGEQSTILTGGLLAKSPTPAKGSVFDGAARLTR